MMKNIKLILTTGLFVLGLSLNAQITSNNLINATISSESAFFDVSTSPSTNNSYHRNSSRYNDILDNGSEEHYLKVDHKSMRCLDCPNLNEY